MISPMLSRVVASLPAASRPNASRQAVALCRPDVIPSPSQIAFNAKSEFSHSSQANTSLQTRSDVGFNSIELSLSSSSELSLFSSSGAISLSTHQSISLRALGHDLEEKTPPVPCALEAVPEPGSDPMLGSASTGKGDKTVQITKWLASLLAFFGLFKHGLQGTVPQPPSATNEKAFMPRSASSVGVEGTQAVAQGKKASGNWNDRAIDLLRLFVFVVFLLSSCFPKNPMHEAWRKSLETPVKILKVSSGHCISRGLRLSSPYRLECVKALKGDCEGSM